MSTSRLVTLYLLFAAIATAVNLGCQQVILSRWDGERTVFAALIVGTLAGMPVKYVLDRRYIFRFTATEDTRETQMFITYAGFAGITTVIFWGCELVAGAITGTNAGHLVGGAIGLAIGYALKYRLDRKWVFVTPVQA